MFAVSQIIERNLHRRKPGGCVLWINHEKDDCWRAVQPACSSLTLFCQDYGCYTFLQGSGAVTEFGAFPERKEKKYDWIIVNLPRQKALLKMVLDCAAASLKKDGVLWLAGENRAGIKSANKLLKLHFEQVRKLDNARHCGLFEADTPLDRDVFDHLAYREFWDLKCDDSGVRVVSYPGVFAHGRLDDGTALLIKTLATTQLEGQFEGDVLDFACGAGIIGACVASLHKEAVVTFLDTSALALMACAETLELNHLNGHLLASDGLSQVSGSYDIVFSNPPIHAGAKTDTQLGLRLLEPVREHIRPGGKLILVANVHLPYENWLSSRFKRYGELAANKNYKVIMAANPR